MSSTIDERVVQMRFDNKQFESNVKTSVKSLDDLKNGLNFDGSVRSLQNLEKAGRNFNLSTIAQGVQSLADRFSTLGIVGISVINNLTNTALNAGKRMVSALTIDPIKTGLQEYETKMNSIQTILTNTSSKGTTIDDVNKALAELNEYADKTIYNFSEMTRNIGTFTAAGVDLKTSTQSIKGIANLAAGSGSGAQQASTAMYQLSQAIAAGSVKLMDWNSVVNAGMGGELFQKALEKTAKELGHGRNMAVSFRESLESGWLTTEVLTKTLNKFANDPSLIQAATQVKTFTQLFDTMKESVQSGWAISWEHIIGNKEEAAKTLTAVNDAFNAVIGKTSDARNDMLAYWKAMGGRDMLIEGITNAFKGLQSILKPVGQAFRDIFPAMTGQRLVDITKSFRDLTKNFKIGEDTAANIKRTFKGLFSIWSLSYKAIGMVATGFATLVKHLLPAGDGLVSLTGNFGDLLTKINASVKASDSFKVAMDKIGEVVDNAISGILKGLKKTAPAFYGLANLIGGAFDKMREVIVKAFETRDFSPVLEVINGGIFATILYGIKKFIDSLTNITNGAGGFLRNVTGILDGVKGSLEAYQSQLKAGTLLKIAISIGILAASLVAIASIDSAKLTTSLMAMTTMFIELFAAMSFFETLSGSKGFLSMGKISVEMLTLSTSVLILSAAMAKLGSLDFEQIKNGLIGIGGLMAELGLFMKFVDKGGMGTFKGLGLIGLAAGINILALAVKQFSSMDPEALKTGLMGVGAVLAELSLFVTLTGDSKRVISTAIGITILGGAMLILSRAIASMGNLQMDQIGRGLLAMGGALAIITIALNLLPKGILLQSLAMIDMATAITMLANALSKMGELSWDQIARGLTAIGVSLGIIVAAFKVLKNEIIDAAAIVIVVASITLLAKALQTLGSMSLAQVAVSLIALAGAFGVIGLAGVVLGPLVPTIFALAGSITLLGLGCLAAGAGIALFATGLAALAVSGTAAGAAFIGIVKGLVQMIPDVLKMAAQGLIDFAKILGDGAPVIGNAMVNIIKSLINAIVVTTPNVVKSLLQLLTTLLRTMLDYVPQMTDAGMKLLKGFLKAISANIRDVIDVAIDVVINFIKGVSSSLGKVIQAGIDLVISFVNGIAAGIRKNTKPMINAVQNVISAIVDAAITTLTGSVTGFIQIGEQIVEGLILGLKNMIVAAGRAAGQLGSAVLESAKSALGIHSPSIRFEREVGEMAGAGFAKGIVNSTKKPVEASKKMATASVKAAKDAFDKAIQQIEDRKYYNQLNLTQELKSWEALQKRYKAGSEERKKVDKEVYRVKQELNAADVDMAQKALDLQQTFNEKKKSLEDEYYDKTKEINDKLKQDIDDVTKAYEDAVKSRTESLYNTYGLFDKVEKRDPVSGTEMINNLKDQVVEFSVWQSNITSLSKRAIDEGLLEELKAMGPKALGEMTALNKMTDGELATYVGLWKTKHALAKSEATAELEGLRLESVKQIELLKIDAEKKLEDNKIMWATKMRELVSETSIELAALNKEWSSKMGILTTETRNKFTALSTDLKNTVKVGEWTTVGENAIKGMTEGIKKQSVNLATQSALAAKAALDAAKKTLGIQSPSKEFAKVGMYANEGFALGLTNFTGKVSSSAERVANTAMASLRSSLSNIVDLVTSDVDMNPTIRPVLDLTDVTTGVNTIGNLLNGTSGISLSSANSKVASINSAMKPIKEAATSKATQTNNSPNADTPKSPTVIQLMLQNGKAIAEFIMDDMDGLMGSNNQIVGRMAGIR